MGFTCEYISKDDIEKYEIKRLNKRVFAQGSNPARDWVVNREEDIWLREFCYVYDHTAPDGDFTGVSFWDFYWKGSLVVAKVQTISVIASVGEHGRARKKLMAIDIPNKVLGKKLDILKDFERALSAHKDGGIHSKCPTYDLTLEVDKVSFAKIWVCT